MDVVRRFPRRRTLYMVAALFLVSVIVVSTFAASQGKATTPRNDPKDPRNTKQVASMGYGEKNGNTQASDCWAHHKGEGMRDVFVLFPILPKQAKVGEPVDIPVQIINPWRQRVQKMELEVALTGAKKPDGSPFADNLTQIVAVEGGKQGPRQAQDLHYYFTGELGPSKQQFDQARNHPAGSQVPPHNKSIPIDVPERAAFILARLEYYPVGGVQNTTAGPVLTQNADTFEGTGYVQPNKTYKVALEDRMSGFDNKFQTKYNYTRQSPTAGRGFFELVHYEGYASRVKYYLNVTIITAAGPSGRSYSVPIPPDAFVEKNSAPYPATVRITPLQEGIQLMEFHVRAEIYYKHQDGVTPNEDFYNRYQTLSLDSDTITGTSVVPSRALYVGPAFVPSDFSPVGASAAPEQWQFVMAETSGFAAAALLVPSLLLGGTYGKASRRFFNTILGGAKRRVMFHNLLSLGLSLVAIVHILLFTYEVRYTILMGVMWGGLGTLSLLALALTGYYQVPLIQRHGYKWWRFTHLAFGLLVVVFVSYHAIADGADFNFIRQALADWPWEFNLSNK